MPAPHSPIPKNHIRVHYHRPDLNFTGWKLYAFGDTTENTNDFAIGPVQPAGADEFGIFFDVGVTMAAQRIGFIIHNGDTKDPGSDMFCSVGHSCEFWVLSGDPIVHSIDPMTSTYTGLQAFWIDRDTVCIPVEHYDPAWNYSLAYSPEADLPETLATSPSLVLIPGSSLTPEQVARFPQLKTYSVLKLPTEPVETLSTALKGQLLLVAVEQSGPVAYVTGVQIAGVLDDLFFYGGPLGPTYSLAGINVRLWAPTAQSVELLLFDTSAAEWPVRTIRLTESSGVWSASLDARYQSRWYLYRVKVYVPAAQQILENPVTDPYSVDLSLNGGKSRFTNLDNPRTKPTGWDQHASPSLTHFADQVIYELHVRDFSASDNSVPEEHRGSYLAFTHPGSAGMRHLRDLADAGLTSLHLLPTFHFSSVNEDRLTWQTPGDLARFPPESEHQQAAIAAIQDIDPYNWGYDPVHYMSPSGAYAVDPDSRVLEYRRMVQALHSAGLRVIQDCVFNHTSSSGQAPFSVLDKVVPTYYHRLDPTGNIYNSSCCSDTASEHRMMERLIIDTLLTNARQYKIDGFRFDLMGFHLVENMRRIRQALSQLTLEKDGVDGSTIYLYGEGWNFGETANNRLGPAATQLNMYGLGIGSFNDRVRDGIRGGSPFTDQRIQGFATGAGSSADLLHQTDWIRIALAGNLRDFRFTVANGQTAKASDVDYIGSPAGYTASPIEIINYCSVHDNQTLFDAIQIKAPAGESSAQRARRQVLALSLVALAQGVPLFHAGDDLLRSKDMDQNSFNSGDWFNRIDWAGQSNNWGIGLAMAHENRDHWPIHRPLLADPAFKPTPQDIAFTRSAFQEFLRIRKSSSLLRMRTFDEVQSSLRFLNTGPNQIPKLIVMLLQSGSEKVCVVFNANSEEITFTHEEFAGLQLHPIQTQSADPLTRASQRSGTTLTVPALTTAVFIAS